VNIKKVFDEYLESKPLFKDRSVLTNTFSPEEIPHRDKQINDLGKIVAPALKGGKPSNVFIYGRCGTGKTVVSRLVGGELEKMANNHQIKVIYINCKLKKTADTEYRLLATLAKDLGKDVPFTGLPTDQIYHIFFEALDSKKQTVILIIDEIDTLIAKTGDEVLYNLTRINQDLKNSTVTVLGIANNLGFLDTLDPRVKSSLSEEELIFPPYNAVELQDILRQRSKMAFGSEILDSGVIEKCAALAAQEHGDARRALDLLRVAAELAERNNEDKVTLSHVDRAQDKIDIDRVVEIVKNQPRQSQLVMWAILSMDKKNMETSDVISAYTERCKKNGFKPLTQRRISDLISEYDLFGIINSRIISKGRYGRTRVVSFDQPVEVKNKIHGVLSKVFL